MLAATPKVITDKLQRVFNAAACVLSGTNTLANKFETGLHNVLHWLDVPDRVTYKLGVMVFR